MRTYWLTDRSNGEMALVDGATVERVLGVELQYVDQCIRDDGVFENGMWIVKRGGCRRPSRGMQQAHKGLQTVNDDIGDGKVGQLRASSVA